MFENLTDFQSGNLRRETFLLKKSYLDIHSSASQDFGDEEAEANDEKKAEEAKKALAAAQYHKIRSGDTLGGIAARYGTTVSEASRTVECGLHLYLYYRFRKSFLYLTPKNSASSCISLSFIVFILGMCAVSMYICAAFSTVSIRPKVSSIVLPAP